MIKKNYKYISISNRFPYILPRFGNELAKRSPGWQKQVTGQSSIEFVLVIPVLIIVILAVFQLGYYIYCKNILIHAAREGARVLATTNSSSLAIQQVLRSCNSLEIGMLDIELNPPSNNARSTGDFASIDLSYRYGGIGDFLSIIMNRDIYIESTCLMRMECGI